MRPFEEEKELVNKIIKKLLEKSGEHPCSLCDGEKFTVFPGYSIYEVTPELITFPVVQMYCENCGYMRQHAGHSLGLTAKKEEII